MPMPGDNPDALLDMLSEKKLRLQCEGELAYLRGDFCRVIDCYRTTDVTFYGRKVAVEKA